MGKIPGKRELEKGMLQFCIWTYTNPSLVLKLSRNQHNKGSVIWITDRLPPTHVADQLLEQDRSSKERLWKWSCPWNQFTEGEEEHMVWMPATTKPNNILQRILTEPRVLQYSIQSKTLKIQRPKTVWPILRGKGWSTDAIQRWFRGWNYQAKIGKQLL